MHTATALICSFKAPPEGRPCLLQHNEVLVLFHELGHGIHDLVAKTEYARFHGASTASDFNEAPSQMLEEWCWHPETLRRLSKHYSTISSTYHQIWREQSSEGAETPEEVIPETLIEKLTAERMARSVQRCLTLLQMSLFDISTNGPRSTTGTPLDPTRIYYETLHRVLGTDIPDEDELPPYQATQANHFNVSSGMHIYLL